LTQHRGVVVLAERAPLLANNFQALIDELRHDGVGT
jgi:hypothetical protein